MRQLRLRKVTCLRSHSELVARTNISIYFWLQSLWLPPTESHFFRYELDQIHREKNHCITCSTTIRGRTKQDCCRNVRVHLFQKAVDLICNSIGGYQLYNEMEKWHDFSYYDTPPPQRRAVFAGHTEWWIWEGKRLDGAKLLCLVKAKGNQEALKEAHHYGKLETTLRTGSIERSA